MSVCMVTGGAGFIGRHLVRRLAELGHDVIVVDTDTNRFCGFPGACYGYDVADEVNEELDKVFEGCDVVFHLAAVSRTVPAIDDPFECMRVNVLGTANVLELARRKKVPRVVVSSSNVVYAGATPYRDSKIAVENLCETYGKLYGQSVIGLRYSNVYGSGIPVGDPAVFAMLRDSFNSRGHAEVTGDGGQSRDFTHVSDIVEGNIRAWKSDYRGVVDLCTGNQTTINRACKLLKIPVNYIPERPGDVRAMYQDPNAAQGSIGWSATVRLKDGIKDIWATE